jgi:hypothetical protein
MAININSVVEKSHLCANAVERRMKMSLISCYYVLRYTSKEKSHEKNNDLKVTAFLKLRYGFIFIGW